MENNFEERRKDVDLSNIDLDANIYQRKKLELDDRYEKKAETETSFYLKERELANNNDEELIRRVKVAAIDNDHNARVAKLQEEYDAELSEIQQKYERKYTRPLYFKWIYIGPVGKYTFDNGKTILCVMPYYVKVDEFDNMLVYNDAKYSDFLGQIKYIPEEWKE